jgi:hypothetical protein
LFKAAKGDSPKRNSGLRTEITADSPLVAQGMFQDFPSVPSPRTMDPNAFSRNYPVGGAEIPAGPRRDSVPHTQPYRESPNNRRRTPGRPAHQSRPNSHNNANHTGGPGVNSGKAGVNGAPASVKKPATSMMSFVPSSVAAKKHSSSAPPTSAGPIPSKSAPSADPLVLEQDLKRMLNLNSVADASVVR